MTPPIRSGVVSTIIAVYNRPRLLADAVRSVLAQTYRPIELLIIDDGSTDDTAAVAQAFAAEHPEIVRYVRRPHEGVARSRNQGLRIASGEFIQILDSDDLLMPEKFATQVQALRAYPECGLSYCYTREYAIGDPLPRRPARRSGETFERLFPHILAGRLWPFPSPLFRREILDACGPFLELNSYEDWELECRIAALDVRAHHCRMFLADTRDTTRLEGRRRGRPPLQAIRDNAEVHELILGHARRAGLAESALDLLSGRLFAVARQCAAVGLETEARRCLALGLSAAASPSHRRYMAMYAAASDQLGWQTVGSGWKWAHRLLARVDRRRRAFVARWRHRATSVCDAVIGEPVTTWPRRLVDLWSHRTSKEHFQRW